MTVIDSIILGIVQGITEFLPVSSSGHLTLMAHYLGIKEPMLAYDILLHLGTFIAVLIFFRKIIITAIKDTRIWLLIIISMVPTAIAGLIIKKYFSTTFDNILFVSITLIITGLYLFTTKWIKYNENSEQKNFSTIGPLKALLIGISQSLAIFPGISRSGTTITTALWLKCTHKEAVNFSFIIFIPAILGAIFLEILNLDSKQLSSIELNTALTGLVSAFLFGYLALIALTQILKNNKLYWFAPYLWILAIITIVSQL